MINRATLIVMNARPDPKLPPTLAVLAADEQAFLTGHIEDMRKRASNPDGQRARFTASSDMLKLLRRAAADDDGKFLNACEAFAIRLRDSMKIASNPKQGIFVVASVKAPNQTEVSLLKLDADVEVARWNELTSGGVKLSVLKHCLPGPGSLQKGLSWPDDRDDSDVVVMDRNRDEAQYFVTAFHLALAPKAIETEKALHAEIVKLPPDQRTRAINAASERAGNVSTIVAAVKEVAPDFNDSREVFGAGGGVAGRIRPNQMPTRTATLAAGDIKVQVPMSKMEAAVSNPVRVGDHWEVTVRFPREPKWT